MADDTPKIIVDSDWKAQAQAEKERLAAKEAASRPVSKAPAGSVAGSSGSSPRDGATRAPADQEEGEITLFEELLRMLASQALLYMGAFPDPSTGQAVLSPEMAKLHIDMLGMIEEKTKGNLSETESQVIRSYLHELRMQYIEISRAVAKAIQEGRLKPQSSGGVAMPGSSGGVVGPGPLG
jgi:hypothetical protein